MTMLSADLDQRNIVLVPDDGSVLEGHAVTAVRPGHFVGSRIAEFAVLGS